MEKSESKILTLFNHVGAAFVFFGISYFIEANWPLLNNFLKIFSTLGVAIAAYIVGVMLNFKKKWHAASSAFFLVAGLVLPIGLVVTFDIVGLSSAVVWKNVLITGVCFTIFILSQLFSSRAVFLLFSIIFGSLFFLSLMNYLSNYSAFFIADLSSYQLIALGVSYIFLGRYLDQKNGLVGLLYFFGGLFILSASFSLSGIFYSNIPSVFWKSVTGMLIILFFMLSVSLKSRALLYLAAFFLVFYVIDISIQYANLFGDLGWPLILVSIGFLLMATGYGVYYLHKKIAS